VDSHQPETPKDWGEFPPLTKESLYYADRTELLWVVNDMHMRGSDVRAEHLLIAWDEGEEWVDIFIKEYIEKLNN
jgi:hypothetical protein